MRLSLESILTCSAVAVVGGYRYPNTHSTASHAAFMLPNRPPNCHWGSRGGHYYHDHYVVSISAFAESPRGPVDGERSVPGLGRKRKAVREAIASIQKKMAAVRPTRGVSSTNDFTRDAADGFVQSVRSRVELGEDKWYDPAVEEVEYGCAIEAEATAALDALAIAKTAAADALDAAESEIGDAQILLDESKRALRKAKAETASALMTAEMAAMEALSAARKATTIATAMADETKNNSFATANQIAEGDATGLSYDDVDYHLSEMSPPFLDEDQCLVPGEALVRVEKAPGKYYDRIYNIYNLRLWEHCINYGCLVGAFPSSPASLLQLRLIFFNLCCFALLLTWLKENSRRIFAGIDIMASTEAVWNVSERIAVRAFF